MIKRGVNMIISSTRPAWVEVNLDNIGYNLKEIRNIVSPKAKIMCIVKSNAYKAGALALTNKYVEMGIDYFGVATLSEGISLRNHFPNIKILILGYSPQFLMEELAVYNIMPNIYSLDDALKLNDICKSMDKVLNIHLSLETGMGRIGFLPNEKSLYDIKEISRLSNLKIDGIFSHFAVSDSDPVYTKKQFEIFMNFCKKCEEKNISLGIKHIANSASILNYRDYDLDMVRPGIILHGLHHNLCPEGIYNFKRDVEVRCLIANIKTIKKGDTVSYGRNFTASSDTKIVTLPLGYADGFPRILSGKLSVLINGKKCRQVGNICMDQMMIDATGVDCKIGDLVTLIGKDGDEEIEFKDIADLIGDIETSMLTHLSERLPRIYLENNEIKYEEDIIKFL